MELSWTKARVMEPPSNQSKYDKEECIDHEPMGIDECASEQRIVDLTFNNFDESVLPEPVSQ